MSDKEDIVEFTDSVGQGEVPEPVAKSSKRPADKTDGEKAIPQFATKVEAISAAVQAMAGMPKEKIADIFSGMADALSAEKSKSTRRIGGSATDAGAGESLAATKRSPTSATAVAAEEIDVVFGGEELSEEAREKTRTIFEAAVNARIAEEVARLEEEFEANLVEALEEKIEALSENVDKYLSYAVEQWVENNEIAIESGLKAEVTEEFIRGLKNLFVENYVEIPDDKVDLVSELSKTVAELEEKVNSVVKENVELKDYVDSLEVDRVFAEAVDALPLTQQEKLRSLVEGIEYSDVEEFTKKLNVIKETYFPTSEGKKAVSLTEAVDEDTETETTEVTGPMSHYVKAISKTAKK